MKKSEELQQDYSDLLDEQQKIQQLLFETNEQNAEIEQQLIQARHNYGKTLVNCKIGKGAKKEVDAIKSKVIELSGQLKEIQVVVNYGHKQIKVLEGLIIDTQRSLGCAQASEQKAELRAKLVGMRDEGLSVNNIASKLNLKVPFIKELLGINQSNYNFS